MPLPPPPQPWPPRLGIPPAPSLEHAAEPTAKPGRQTRKLVRNARDVDSRLRRDTSPVRASIARITERTEAVREEFVRHRLAALSIDRLVDLVDGGLRLSALKSAGVATAADVLAHPGLTDITGVGTKTATGVLGAAHQMTGLVRDGLGVRFDVDTRPDSNTRLLAALARHPEVVVAEANLTPRVAAARAPLAHAARQAKPLTRNWLVRLLAPPDEEAVAGVVRLEQALGHIRNEGLLTQVQSVYSAPDDRHSPDRLWEWFLADPAAVYGLLAKLAGIPADQQAQVGHLPNDIVEAVRAQRLDTTWLDVSLRGYQAFGARYGLVQDRVLIGDEMGLGKTIIALAVAAHLWANGHRHVLVVCPASVLLNWKREIHTHSKMSSAHLHGPDREQELHRWRDRGGIAVTTYGTLGSLPGPTPTDLLVADEAHYVKNPDTQRSRHLRRWLDWADRVMYLTGTPLENRVDEFRELVRQLQPDVAERVDDHFALAGSDGFATKVAPVYLRRNQEDVLTELPDRLEMEDWVEPTARDAEAYRTAVAGGNFMAMRQASWVHAASGGAAKMQRLAEIIAEAAEERWKTVVFSYFLATLAGIVDGLDSTALDVAVFGPLTGATSSEDRLQLVDDFSAHDGPAVLVSQIVAGGVGLNIQAASVVVLAEPQWKPSTEEQAIARAHRMGQVRRVTVHRLLVRPGVDQRMKELVEHKTAIFDDYARQSAIADQAPDAVDRNEDSMMEQILVEETERLGLDRTAQESLA